MRDRLMIAAAAAGCLAVALVAAQARAAEPTPRMTRDAAPAAAAMSPSGNRAVAEEAARLLETQYVSPEIGARYAATLRSHAARGDYAAYTDSQKLGDRLTADLQAVHADGHIHFYKSEPPPPEPAPAAALQGSAPPATATGPTESASPAPGIREMKWIRPGVAYLSFEHFDDRPEALAAVSKFLHDYRDARALVIDSRGNHGGAFDMMGLIANHLFAAPRHLADMDMAEAVVAEHGAPFPIDGKILRRTAGPKGLVRFEHWAQPVGDDAAWFNTPVYYLTSHETFSAAEHLAMILKTTGRATLVGEATGGGNHFGGTVPVGEGLELFVAVGHTTDPATGQDWEAVGVQPDVKVPAAEALDEALRRIAATPQPSSPSAAGVESRRS